MKRINSLYVCSCCGRVTRDLRGDACGDCREWAVNEITNLFANGIQVKVASRVWNVAMDRYTLAALHKAGVTDPRLYNALRWLD